MKVSLLSAAVIASLSVGFMQSAQAESSASRTIYFYGKAVDSTCEISVNGGAADNEIILPTVSQSILNTEGKTAGETTLHFRLSGCTGTSLNNAYVKFEGTNNVTPESRYSNIAATNPATNVEIELQDKNGNQVLVGSNMQGTADTYIDVTDGGGEQQYSARYYATGAATPGLVEALLVYSISYE